LDVRVWKPTAAGVAASFRTRVEPVTRLNSSGSTLQKVIVTSIHLSCFGDYSFTHIRPCAFMTVISWPDSTWSCISTDTKPVETADTQEPTTGVPHELTVWTRMVVPWRGA
jgi:hypothetical protein